MRSLFGEGSRRWIGGHRLTLLKDGAEIVPAMLHAIEGATRSVHLETYIFRGDDTGRQFIRALCDKAGHGVSVKLIYDALGSLTTPREVFAAMAAAGVDVFEYHPLSPWNPGWRLKRRDHRKLLIVDDRVGFVGGMNIGNEYADPGRGGGGWRDTQVRIEGPAVGILQRIFLRTWSKNPASTGDRWGEGRSPIPAVGDSTVAVAASWGRRRRNPIKRSYLDAIRRARSHIYLTSSYFVPPPRILWALKMARRRGVHVLILVPARSDVRVVDYAGRALYDQLLQWGVRIFEWRGPVLHAKTAVIDGMWSTVGSYNMDYLSFFYNLEANVMIRDGVFAAAMEAMFRDDLRQSGEIVPAEWRRRHPVRKVLETALYYLLAWF
ncbi:MAG: phospholipase D-like domain-containing protein [Nitrospiria bacterium]